jgi:hypothetical protein
VVSSLIFSERSWLHRRIRERKIETPAEILHASFTATVDVVGFVVSTTAQLGRRSGVPLDLAAMRRTLRDVAPTGQLGRSVPLGVQHGFQFVRAILTR